MLIEYINEAVKIARYKKLEDNSWFGDIAGLEGVWANSKTLEDCKKELVEVLEEWLILKIRDNDQIPVINGIDLSIKEVVLM